MGDPWKRRGRAGSILVVVVVCLLIVMGFATGFTRHILANRRHARQMEFELQALWIGESAWQRAEHALRADTAYRGETWQVPADLLQTGYTARAVIEVLDEENSRRLRVQAYYPDDARHRVLFQREQLLPNLPPGSGDPQ